MIKLINLNKIYVSEHSKSKTVALDNINLEFENGEFVAIVGKSGSGKSTLINLIGGLDMPTNGNVEVDNVDLSTLDEKRLAKYRNKKVGFVFQSYYLEPSFSVLKNVALPLIIDGVKSDERERRARDVLAQLDLSVQADKKINELSGGEMQRVAIARALVGNPSIILADEPTGNLDTENGEIVIELLRQCVNNNRIVILVTHNELEASHCDRVIRLKDGKVVENSILHGSTCARK